MLPLYLVISAEQQVRIYKTMVFRPHFCMFACEATPLTTESAKQGVIQEVCRLKHVNNGHKLAADIFVNEGVRNLPID